MIDQVYHLFLATNQHLTTEPPLPEITGVEYSMGVVATLRDIIEKASIMKNNEDLEEQARRNREDSFFSDFDDEQNLAPTKKKSENHSES